MISKLTIFILTLLLIIPKNDIYNITISINKNHTTTVYLKKNNYKTDSLVVNDYYGKNKLTKIGFGKWLFVYSNRCGTGCKIKNQIIFSIENNKLIKSINIPFSYIEYRENINSKKFKKVFLISKLNSENLILKKICYSNNKPYFTKTEKLKFDSNDMIFYNRNFILKSKKYKGISIDSSEYIFVNKKWYEYESKNKKTFGEI